MAIIRRSPEEIRAAHLAQIEKYFPPVKPSKQEWEMFCTVERERFWNNFVGQRLTFQIKGGPVIEGALVGEENGFLRIEEATVTGANYRTRTPWLMLDGASVLHFHPAGGEVERLKK